MQSKCSEILDQEEEVSLNKSEIVLNEDENQRAPPSATFNAPKIHLEEMQYVDQRESLKKLKADSRYLTHF